MATDTDTPSSIDVPLLSLRSLPLAARVLIAAFLISVGIGYGSAIVQLHMQHASAGEVLPNSDDVIRAYHGQESVSTLERLITADETLPFNGSGSMRIAFTSRSTGWPAKIRTRAKAKEINKQQAEQELRQERELEIASMVEWIHAGGEDKTYSAFTVSDELAGRFPEDVSELGKDLFTREDKKIIAHVNEIVDLRCVRCHSPTNRGAQGDIHLNDFEVVQTYLIPEHGGGMSLHKLAQSTHVHLLGFAMLYGLTGLIFSLTSWSVIVRVLLAPFPLVMQVIDISCWWLARLPGDTGATFAQIIPITGGLVGLGLLAHIALGSLNLFGAKGKIVVVVLFLAGAAVAGLLFGNVIGPYLASEQLLTSQ